MNVNVPKKVFIKDVFAQSLLDDATVEVLGILVGISVTSNVYALLLDDSSGVIECILDDRGATYEHGDLVQVQGRVAANSTFKKLQNCSVGLRVSYKDKSGRSLDHEMLHWAQALDLKTNVYRF